MPQPEPWIIAQRIQVGSRLRSLREHRDVSQEALGLAAGLSKNSVYRAEHGVTSLSLDHLVRYARELKVPLIWFFNDEPLPSSDH